MYLVLARRSSQITPCVKSDLIQDSKFFVTMTINKDLIAASATPLVLAILAESESYGYAIIKRVKELSSDQLQWTDGMLYPVLHRLERQGHITASWGKSGTGRKRKYYQLTPQGRAQLNEHKRQWQIVDNALQGMWNLVLNSEAAYGKP